MHRCLPAIILSCLVYGGCVSDRFQLTGESDRPEHLGTQYIQTVDDRLRNSRSLSAPRLLVSPNEALGRRYEPVVVKAHSWSSSKQMHQLDLRTGDGQTIALAYDFPGKTKLPVVVGSTYKIRIFHSTTLPNQRYLDEEPVRSDTSRHAFVLTKRRPDYPDFEIGGVQGWSLVIRDESNTLRALIFSGRWRALDPNRHAAASVRNSNGLSLEVLDRTAYTEVRRTKDLCRVVLEHVELAAVADGRTHELLPGTSVDVDLSGGNYRLMVLDASRAEESTCGAKQEAHVSFGLVLSPSN
jgi:hypothetical protein